MDRPLFAKIMLNQKTPFSLASTAFVSLISFIHRGGDLTEELLSRAVPLLSFLTPKTDARLKSDQILFSLFPQPNPTCHGFARALLTLLDCGQETVVLRALELLEGTISFSNLKPRFRFLETDFFITLQTVFQRLNPTTMLKCCLPLFSSIFNILILARPSPISHLITSNEVTEEVIRQTVFAKVIQPLESFFIFVCRHYDKLDDTNTSHLFPRCLTILLELSPADQRTLDLVLSLPICFTLTRCLVWFTTSRIVMFFQDCLSDCFSQWKHEKSMRIERNKAILAHLNEEGFADEEDLFACNKVCGYPLSETIRQAKSVLNEMGANVPLNWSDHQSR